MNQPIATPCRKGHLAEYGKPSGGHSSAPDLLQQLTLIELPIRRSRMGRGDRCIPKTTNPTLRPAGLTPSPTTGRRPQLFSDNSNTEPSE